FAISYDPKINRLMEDLDLPGWDLTSLPDDPSLISKAWIEYYANGEALSQDRLQFMLDRALIHREILFESLNG
ncbi:MAG: polysaccharide pyruvyl transferase CsaB, partial [Cyanobacteria bacterium J06639_18]